jgi:MerR family transcriptional regulator/heat shock protein HspR
MYSTEDVDDIRRILRLTRDLGVNLAGVEIILRMRRQMLTMHEELEKVAAHVGQEPGVGSREAVAGDGALVRVADRRLRKLDVF